MKYYIIDPEVAGGFGKGTIIDQEVYPPNVKLLDYEFYGWLGDVLLESFPCYIATLNAVEELQRFPVTGVQFDDVVITKSSQFDELYPRRILPEFRWLKVHGKAGLQDFGLTGAFRLVVSDRVLNSLKALGISNAIVENFEL